MTKRASLGTRLYTARKEKGLTQQTVANKAGITQGLLSKLENGTVPGVAFTIVKSVAKTLNVDIATL